MANSVVQAGQPFAINYTTADGLTNLNVMATVVDVTSGYPGTVVTQIQLIQTPVGLGSYGGLFTGLTGKTYQIVIGVYTDSVFPFTTPDPERSAVDYEVQCVTFGINIGTAYAASVAMTGKFLSPKILKAYFLEG